MLGCTTNLGLNPAQLGSAQLRGKEMGDLGFLLLPSTAVKKSFIWKYG